MTTVPAHTLGHSAHRPRSPTLRTATIQQLHFWRLDVFIKDSGDPHLPTRNHGPVVIDRVYIMVIGPQCRIHHSYPCVAPLEVVADLHFYHMRSTPII